MRRAFLIGLALVLGACGADEDKDGCKSDCTNAKDVLIATDGLTPDDTRSTPDQTDPEASNNPDQRAGLDTTKPDKPMPKGDGDLGEECMSGWDCLSGLCWASGEMSGCTEECLAQTHCQQYGLICTPFVDGIAVCAPPPAVGTQCAGHQDCTFPTTCLEEFNWCDLPECTLDGDCPAGEVCETSMRKCQPEVCSSTYECENPTEFCLDGKCGPPNCIKAADCADGEVCSFAQGICENGTPCNEEGKCNFYHQQCVNGLCEPNLCATPCANESEVCNPSTGECGPACANDGQCPAGMGCADAAGACYVNLPPVAVPLVGLGDQKKAAASLPSGTTAGLDGAGSFDPEGFPVTHSWMLLAKPPTSPLASGTIFCSQAECKLGPLSPGLFQVGLWVKDELGTSSIQRVVTIFVE